MKSILKVLEKEGGLGAEPPRKYLFTQARRQLKWIGGGIEVEVKLEAGGRFLFIHLFQ